MHVFSLARVKSSPIMATPMKSMKLSLKMGTSSASTEFLTGEEIPGVQVQVVPPPDKDWRKLKFNAGFALREWRI